MLRTELRTEQEKNKALIEERDADRDRYQRVIAEINSSSPLQLRRRKLDNVASSGQPLDRDDRKVKVSDAIIATPLSSLLISNSPSFFAQGQQRGK
ncbi:hypothetical protein TrLO_g3052 [Triparma laevis f. longispina]|uniref:Uncharacterized protein n=1 Tax=Triparma laevis f. longispina TaxID=1714387 RepID=A0A9W7EJF6_9STRA|nr:hypothetical protein TrLO_g3052 [Triparma laevis f. longispina]